MEEKQILIKGLTVNYKVFGPPLTENTASQNKSKPMLILHGWPSSSEKWIEVGALLAEKGLKVIIPDLPGFGKSQEPLQALNTDGYIEWIREFCDNLPDLKKDFYLVGHSFGGGLSAKFAVKYNQRIIKLFLISAATIREITPKKKFFYKMAKIVKIFSFIPYYDFIRKAFYKFVIRKSDYIYQKGIMKDTYVKIISEDLSFRLSFIKVPTIIIWGDKDNLTPIEDANFIHEKIKDSKLIVINDKKHSLQLEAPEILTEKILENV